MQINITLDTDSAVDLAGLTALVAALGGRVTSAAPSAARGELRMPGDDDDTLQPVDHSDEDESIVSAAVAAGAPSVDSAGIKWDERIHSASRATTADGTWRRRKNTPQETFDAVMAELRPLAAPTSNDTPEPPRSEPAVTEPAADAAGSVSEDIEKSLDRIETLAKSMDVPPPPAAAGGPDLSSWPKFVQSVQDKPGVSPEAKTYGALNTVSEAFGASKFLEMRDKQDKWASFYEMIG